MIRALGVHRATEQLAKLIRLTATVLTSTVAFLFIGIWSLVVSIWSLGHRRGLPIGMGLAESPQKAQTRLVAGR